MFIHIFAFTAKHFIDCEKLASLGIMRDYFKFPLKLLNSTVL